jgi:hypothetical protein
MTDDAHVEKIDADDGCIEVAEVLQALREEDRNESAE